MPDAFKADVRAPVSTFALIAGTPMSGRLTHSFHPSVAIAGLRSSAPTVPGARAPSDETGAVRYDLRARRVIHARETSFSRASRSRWSRSAGSTLTEMRSFWANLETDSDSFWTGLYRTGPNRTEPGQPGGSANRPFPSCFRFPSELSATCRDGNPTGFAVSQDSPTAPARLQIVSSPPSCSHEKQVFVVDISRSVETPVFRRDSVPTTPQLSMRGNVPA